MPLSESDAQYLRDMKSLSIEISAYVVGLKFEPWSGVSSLVRATERVLELLGEAANRVSDECKEANPEIAFRKMTGLRKILAHEYGVVRLEVLWETATDDIPVLLKQLNTLLRESET